MKVSFEGDKAVVHNISGNTILTAIRKNGLYVVNIQHPPGIVANLAQAKRRTVSLDIWHHWFGHAAVDTISHMINKCLVDGLDVSKNAETKGLCEDCIFGIHNTHPFNDMAPVETEVLGCVYVDIWGPAPVEFAGGARYFMLLIDGVTSYQRVYFLSSKSTASMLNVFREYHIKAERQTGKILKHVWSDMGREWHNESWDLYMKMHGIILDFTTPYAHQQNGKAECSLRTLLDMGRTMLADSGLPQKYWADVIQTATYIRNFIPPSNKPLTIPAKHWTQKRQDLSHLRPFGSISYAHIPNEISPSKLLPHSVKLTMVGYFDRTGYKLLDRATGRTYKSRDVIFEEALPHYSTDAVITYPTDNETSGHTPIAPRPKLITALHPNPPPASLSTPKATAIPSPITPQSGNKNVDSKTEVSNLLDDSIVVRRPWREAKMSRRMRESLEYLTRANVASTDSNDLHISKTFMEAMQNAKVWFEPMLKEIHEGQGCIPPSPTSPRQKCGQMSLGICTEI